MATPSMKINSSPSLLKEVREEFSKTYPFLKIEFAKKAGETRHISPAQLVVVSDSSAERSDADPLPSAASQLLWDELAVSGDMTVSELEVLLQYQFGLPLQILRKSGNLWMETRMTRHWTLRQQNDHGADIAFS